MRFPWRTLPWVLAFVALSSGVARTQQIVLFPYLRTLQYCDGTDQAPRFIGEPDGLFATEFTGSLHCANLGRVIRGAQVQAAAA